MVNLIACRNGSMVHLINNPMRKIKFLVKNNPDITLAVAIFNFITSFYWTSMAMHQKEFSISIFEIITPIHIYLTDTEALYIRGDRIIFQYYY